MSKASNKYWNETGLSSHRRTFWGKYKKTEDYINWLEEQLILNSVVKSFYCKSESQGKKAKCENECYECAFKRIES